MRPGARRAIAELHALGVREIVMLTGDNASSARAVAREVGIDTVRAGLLPADKVAEVEALGARHATVAMIGDGVNDAPAMARRSFGIAMGAIAADVGATLLVVANALLLGLACLHEDASVRRGRAVVRRWGHADPRRRADADVLRRRASATGLRRRTIARDGARVGRGARDLIGFSLGPAST